MAHNMLQETKAQFARDDPAFLVLLAFWLVISSVGCFFLSPSLSFYLFLSLYHAVSYVGPTGLHPTYIANYIL